MRPKIAISLFLLAVTIGLYWPVHRYEFLNYDDPLFISDHPEVKAGLSWDGIVWALKTPVASNWHPITTLSHMADCQLFGFNAGAHHLVSVCLHAINGALLFLLLSQMTGLLWRSALVAGLFAWHPLRLESVAWVAERKDVLSGLFFLLAILAYVRRLDCRGAGAVCNALRRRGWIWYAAALGLYTLGLMSKPMLVTTPLVLVLLCFWPLKERVFNVHEPAGAGKLKPAWKAPWRNMLWIAKEMLPFFVLALLVGVLTIFMQLAVNSVATLDRIPITARIGNAMISIVAYLGKFVWPGRLAVFYPARDLSLWQVAAATVVVAGISLVAYRVRHRQPWLGMGWAWFLVMLLPVIGLVQVGAQAMADRYTYLPGIGLAIAAVWSAAEWLKSRMSTLCQTSGAVLAVIVLLVCVWSTRSQLSYWQTSITLFSHALKVTERNALAHYNLGEALAKHGESQAAAQHYRDALAINPAYEEAYNNLGCILAEQGEVSEAKQLFEQALRYKPNHARAHRNLGNVFFAEGNLGPAVAEYRRAFELAPDDPATTEALVEVLAEQPDNPLANPKLTPAVSLLKTKELRARLAEACAQRRKLHNAVEAYRLAIELSPQQPDLLNNLAWILATCPDASVRDGRRAISLAQQACELAGFRRTIFVGTLAAAYAEAGRFAEAQATAEKACALAAQQGEQTLVERNRELLALYQTGQPYHEQ
jgi:Flp pilus assembly protein TadD